MKGEKLTRQDIKGLKVRDKVWFEYIGKCWNKTVCDKLHVIEVTGKGKFGTLFDDEEGHETLSTELNRKGFEIEVYEYFEVSEEDTHTRYNININFDYDTKGTLILSKEEIKTMENVVATSLVSSLSLDAKNLNVKIKQSLIKGD